MGWNRGPRETCQTANGDVRWMINEGKGIMKLHSQVEGLAFGLGWSTTASSTVTQGKDGPDSDTGGLQCLEGN